MAKNRKKLEKVFEQTLSASGMYRDELSKDQLSAIDCLMDSTEKVLDYLDDAFLKQVRSFKVGNKLFYGDSS